MIERTLESGSPGLESQLPCILASFPGASHLTPCPYVSPGKTIPVLKAQTKYWIGCESLRHIACSKPASDFPCHLTEGFLPGRPESGPTWPNLLAFSSHPTLLAAPSVSRLVSTPGPLHSLRSSLFFPCTCAQPSLPLSFRLSSNVTFSARSSQTSLFTLHPQHPSSVFPPYHSSPRCGGNLLMCSLSISLSR